VAKPDFVLREQLGAVLRRARTEADLSQEEVADRADLDRTYISDLERGKKAATVEAIAAIAAALGTSAHALIRDAETGLQRGPSEPPRRR
jgi:transcriptional regulator with XRE-family HTH domain